MVLNRVVLIGRLTRNPEHLATVTGVSVAKFTLALDSRSKDEDGNRKTLFIPCVCFKETADNVCNALKRGSLITIDGYISQRKYTKDDEERTITEIVCESICFLNKKEKEEKVLEKKED